MNKQFGALLSEGISSIAHRWHKTKAAVCREMTQRLRECQFDLTDSTVGGWCRGFVPKEPELIAWIIRYCMQRGRIDRHWVESMLSQARYPDKAALLKELFPADKEPPDTTVASGGSRLHSVDDPAITLQTPPGCDLIGRKELLAMLKYRLIARENQGMLALTGLPGVGKTTLALELAHSHEVRETFRDGILYVHLGPQPDIEHHLERWAKLLGLGAESVKSADRHACSEAIHTSIGKRQMLLVVEDAWSIEAALAFQLGGPGCTHLLTTRFSDIALRFAGQGVVKVPELNEEESLQLLSRFIPQVVQDEPEQVRTLIHAVGSLPLALTLIGKHLQVQVFHRQPRRLQQALLALQQVRERLFLEAPQGPLQTHRQSSYSLIASINTSYEALSLAAQRALRALCLFPAKPSTFSEEAALVVAAVPVAILDELTDAGLLESTGAGRYTMHQTIADYALLKHRGQQTEKRLVEFFVTFVEAQSKEYDVLDQEASNILYALSLAVTANMWTSLIRGVQAFFPFLILRSWYETALRYCQHELAAARLLADQQGICEALLHLGTLHSECGNYIQAEEHAQEGLILARQLQHAFHTCKLLRLQGSISSKRGDHARAEIYAQEGLVIARELEDRELICWHLLLVGIAASRKGAYVQAEEALQESLGLARQINQPRAICGAFTALGTLASMRGDYAQAEHAYREGLTVARAHKQLERVSAFLQGLGIVAGMRGDYARAEAHFQEALPLAQAIGLREHLVGLYSNLATVAYFRGKGTLAEENFLQGLALAREMGERDLCGILTGLGLLYSKQAKLESAALYLEESVALAAKTKHSYNQGEALLALSLVSLKQGDCQRAETCLQELADLVRETSSSRLRGNFYNSQGEYYLQQEQIDAASVAFQEALELARKLEEHSTIAHALYGLARVAQAGGNMAEASSVGRESARIFSAVDAYSAQEVDQWLASLESHSGQRNEQEDVTNPANFSGRLDSSGKHKYI